MGYGVLSTASYDARKYGVRSGMPGELSGLCLFCFVYNVYFAPTGFIAKKLCPELIFVPLNFSRYVDMSKVLMSIFARYDPDMFMAGCDEGYLKWDVIFFAESSIWSQNSITPYCQQNNLTADACVQEMRQAVFEETKLTASAGIAPNKVWS